MKLLLKLLVIPIAAVLKIMAIFCSLVLSLTDRLFVTATAIAFLMSLALFVTGQSSGGIAWLITAILISPIGVPAVLRKLVGKIDDAGYMLGLFILS